MVPCACMAGASRVISSDFPDFLEKKSFKSFQNCIHLNTNAEVVLLKSFEDSEDAMIVDANELCVSSSLPLSHAFTFSLNNELYRP